MNKHYTYFLILALSFAGPFLLSFDKKVAFYKKWEFVFPAMIVPAVFYILWDAWFTSIGVWSFNENYITGIKFLGLPLEEILFFFVVPYCCIFIYECIKCYFPLLESTLFAESIFKTIGAILLISGVFFYQRHYTFYSFVFTGLFIMLFFVFRRYQGTFNIKIFLISYSIILLPFLIVNGFLTAIPVVLYNNSENLGIRIYTIPFEDIFYGMLLIMMNIVIFEKLRTQN